MLSPEDGTVIAQAVTFISAEYIEPGPNATIAFRFPCVSGAATELMSASATAGRKLGGSLLGREFFEQAIQVPLAMVVKYFSGLDTKDTIRIARIARSDPVVYALICSSCPRNDPRPFKNSRSVSPMSRSAHLAILWRLLATLGQYHPDKGRAVQAWVYEWVFPVLETIARTVHRLKTSTSVVLSLRSSRIPAFPFDNLGLISAVGSSVQALDPTTPVTAITFLVHPTTTTRRTESRIGVLLACARAIPHTPVAYMQLLPAPTQRHDESPLDFLAKHASAQPYAP